MALETRNLCGQSRSEIRLPFSRGQDTELLNDSPSSAAKMHCSRDQLLNRWDVESGNCYVAELIGSYSRRPCG